MSPSLSEILATIFFALAVLHTFLVSRFEHIAGKFPEGSIGENFFHLIGEVEIVFGLWAGVLVTSMAIFLGPPSVIHYLEALNFTEPLFVFAILAAAATRPIISFAKNVILWIAKLLPVQREIAMYISCLVMGPLLGSFLTEPAAMTVTALILRDRYFMSRPSEKFKYLTLGVLFVNISVGGVLTHFAAPPVIMVAKQWQWDSMFMFRTFGWKAVLGTVTNAALAAWVLRKELQKIKVGKPQKHDRVPIWLTGIHILFLILIVMTAHYAVIFIGLFLFFMGMTWTTREYQDDLKLREGLLVGFFLAGLVVLGGLQNWWLAPLIQKMSDLPLFLGATALTAITDNAALTFLGSQVEGVSETFKYALVAGAVSGGGLTVIANAPNPAGFAILRDCFGSDGISPPKLFAAAAIPTLIVMGYFWLV